MINKQSIYYWFFFPLLALLSAGSMTSCIYDSVLEETDMSGKSTLSITMRGITTTDPSTSGGSYDDYVKTLRVIGYDNAGNVVCNQKWNGSELTVTGTESNTEITLTQQLEEAFTGGTCEFYFIANEDGYSVYTNEQAGDVLSSFLGTSGNLEQAPQKDVLDKCVIATPTEITTLGSSPILMTTSVRSTLKPGDNTINNIELVRCFAKAQLKIVNKSGGEVSVDDPKLVGTYPDSYSLWDGSSSENWKENDTPYEILLSLSESTITEEMQTYPLHTSQEIYFPERLFDAGDNKDGNAMKFSFRLNNTPYEVEIADATGHDFNIRRNTHYTVTATLNSAPVDVTFNIEVIPWTEVEVDVPPFN